MPLRTAILTAIALLVAIKLCAAEPPPRPDTIRSAVAKGLKIIQRSATNYPTHRKCFSCHHQSLPVLAIVSARDHDIEIDAKVLDATMKFSRDFFSRRIKSMRKGRGVGGASMTVGYGLWAYDLVGQKAEETSEAMTEFLLLNQKDDGRWQLSSNRPPLEQSNALTTVMSAYSMQQYATDAQRKRVDAAVKKARKWLSDAKLESQEDHNARLWAAHLFGDGAGLIEAREKVIARQRDDGGWGQKADMASDGYATGQTLWMLLETGLPSDNKMVRRAVQRTLTTQLDDGSYYVKSRSKPIQKFFDNGDPHGTEQFNSIAATCWSVAALARSLDAKAVAAEKKTP